jgi:hypothetical protein
LRSTLATSRNVSRRSSSSKRVVASVFISAGLWLHSYEATKFDVTRHTLQMFCGSFKMLRPVPTPRNIQMRLPKKLARFSACAVALALASSGVAVQLSTNGEGEALILPYYTVRNGSATLISIVNASDSGKGMSLLVNEGKNNAVVRQIDLYLAKGDVWTGALVDAVNGPRLISVDTGCAAWRIPIEGAPFSNGAYTTDAAPLRSLDRTKEGYIEIIELASLVPGSPTDRDITPDASGRRNCALISNASIRLNAADYRPGSGGILASATIVSASMSTSYQAIALNGLGRTVLDPGGANIRSLAGDATSNKAFIHETDPSGVSRYIVAEFDGLLGPYDAVQAVLMQASISGEYTTDEVFATDWVLTMPTKRQAVNRPSPVRPPFQNIWNGTNENATPLGTACDDMTYRLQDREAKLVSTTATVSSQLCWASNVVSVKPSTGNATSSPLASINASSMMVSSPGSGWGTIDLTGAAVHKLVSNANSRIYTFALDGSTSVKTGPITFHGLPVVGVALYSAKFSRTQDNYSSSANLIGRARITQ